MAKSNVQPTKYMELADQLVSEIISGGFPDGKMPSMLKLAAKRSVSLQTAQNAIKVLEQRGLVKCLSGKAGTVIAQPQAELLRHYSMASQPEMDQGLCGSRSELRFVYSGAMLGELMPEVMQQFMKRYPWIDVKLIQSRNTAEFSQPFDVLLTHGRDIPWMARAGRLRVLPEKDNLIPGINTGNYWNDQCFGTTMCWTIPVCRADGPFRNLVDNESLQRTFSRFFEKKESRNITLVLGLYSLMYYFIKNFGMRKLTRDDRDALMKMVEFLKVFIYVNKGGAGAWHNSAFSAKLDGVFFGYSTSAKFFRENKALSDFQTLFGKNYKIPLATNSLAVAADTSIPCESKLLCNYLLQENTQRIFAQKPQFLSPLDHVFRSTCDVRLLPALRDALLYAEPTQMSSRALFMFYSGTYPILDEFFSGRRTCEDAAQEIEAMFNEIYEVQND